MAQKRSRASSHHDRSGIWFTLLIAVIVLVYIIPRVILFFSEEKISYVIARKGTISENIVVQGVVTREEQLFSSVSDGVVEYFYPGSEMLSKNTVVCKICDTDYYGEMLEEKIEDVSTAILNTDTGEYADAFKDLEDNAIGQVNGFLRLKDDTAYSSVYALKESLSGTVKKRQDLFALMSSSQVKQLLEEQEIYQSVQEESSENLWISASGLVSYSYDGYEGWSSEDIEPGFLSSYDSSYKYLDINLNKVKKGDPLYRLVTSQRWDITMFLTEEQAMNFDPEESSYITVTVNGEDPISGQIRSLEAYNGDTYKMVVTINKYVQDHLDDRIVSVVIGKEEYEGMKIPDNCLVEEEFYRIPAAFVFNSQDQIGVMVHEEAGDHFVPMEFVWHDEGYYYYDESPEIVPGTTLLKQDSQEMLSVQDKVKTYGVYLLNTGEPVFQRVVLLYQDQGYSIVDGLELYDHVQNQNGEVN